MTYCDPNSGVEQNNLLKTYYLLIFNDVRNKDAAVVLCGAYCSIAVKILYRLRYTQLG